MKTLTSIILFSLSLTAFANPDMINTMKGIHAKYCEQKVQQACDSLKCADKPETCTPVRPTPEAQKAMADKMEQIKKLCKSDDMPCVLKESKRIETERTAELSTRCKGNRERAEVCYANELNEVILQATP